MTHRNRLAGETSPYLLQHAENPVNWHPWDAAALEMARTEDKPILLSVGYSACHWCHVMAHESFEHEATAQLMNERFVNIKVDREERPDLDKIYQTAHQLLTRHAGGWPLTVFLTPDQQTPFYSGTYFPRESRHGLPAFAEVLDRVADFYREHKTELESQSVPVRQAFDRLNPEPAGSDVVLDRLPLDDARARLEQDFDPRYGGFGRAPKFPHPTSIERLLRHWRGTLNHPEPDLKALYMASLTLRRMAHGGIYDQLAGGFCRYSVDDYWMIPHFEKMLYDNGPLLALYSQAHLATGEPLYKRAADGIANWVTTEMQSGDGCYFSTLDADSEGEEGRFYVWDLEEIRKLLSDDEYTVVERRFGLDRAANFEGRWHLHVHEHAAQLATMLDLDETEIRGRLDSATRKLLKARAGRIRPGRDEKVLTAWNGLMIRGMAIAARCLDRPDLLESATNAADFVRDKLLQKGRLLAVYKDGRARFAAYLDDYAYLIDGLLELVQVRWDSGLFLLTLELAEVMLARFEDRTNGGFYFTADDHESLLCRPKSFSDDATPAGNGIAAQVLGRLGHLSGDERFLLAAENTLRAAWAGITKFPQAHTSLLAALEEYVDPPEIVILRGDGHALDAWQKMCTADYSPSRQVYAIPDKASDLPDALAARESVGKPVAYLCKGNRCSAPILSLDELQDVLTGSAGDAGASDAGSGS